MAYTNQGGYSSKGGASLSAKQITTLVVFGLVAIVVLSVLFGTWQQISTGYRGVYVRWGKATGDLCGEGLNWKMPWIADIVPVSLHTEKHENTTECFTSDTQTVKVTYMTQFRRPDGKVIELYRNYQNDHYMQLVKPREEEALKQVTSQYTAEAFVKNREAVRAKTLEALKDLVGDWLVIVDFNITNIDLSDKLEHAIEEKMVMEQASLAKKFELDKEKKDAEIRVVKANAEAAAVKATGDALRSNPQVAVLEAVKRWDGKLPNMVMVGGGGGMNFPNWVMPMDGCQIKVEKDGK